MKIEIYKQENKSYKKLFTIKNAEINVDSTEYLVDKRKEK